MHINEGKGQLALFYTANNVLLTPLLFIFFTFLLLHNFIVFVPQFFIPSSKISQFLLFSLLNLNFPPSPQFLLSLTILIEFFKISDPTSTLHRPHIDPTSTLDRPHIDLTSTLHRRYQNNQNEEEKKKNNQNEEVEEGKQ